MRIDEASYILGIDEVSFTENGVRQAYARAVKMAHPDVGGKLGDNGAAHNIKRAQEARDVLMAALAKCPVCNGTGQVREGLLNRVCTECKGTGK